MTLQTLWYSWQFLRSCSCLLNAWALKSYERNIPQHTQEYSETPTPKIHNYVELHTSAIFPWNASLFSHRPINTGPSDAVICPVNRVRNLFVFCLLMKVAIGKTRMGNWIIARSAWCEVSVIFSPGRYSINKQNK
jgi:hypothetical protein